MKSTGRDKHQAGVSKKPLFSVSIAWQQLLITPESLKVRSNKGEQRSVRHYIQVKDRKSRAKLLRMKS